MAVERRLEAGEESRENGKRNWHREFPFTADDTSGYAETYT
jgi:hypothetical protein